MVFGHASVAASRRYTIAKSGIVIASPRAHSDRKNAAAQATAEKRVALERNFELFPKFIEELTPTMQALYRMTSEMTPDE